MKTKVLFFFSLVILTLAACQPAAGVAATAPLAPVTVLRDDPTEQIIADLEAYIPERMAQSNIPGLTIALIQDNTTVWAEGYGVANRFTRTPMQADSVFEVASLSKVVAAYTAMHMLDEGQLSLDEPVYSLPPSPTGTLEQLMMNRLPCVTCSVTAQVFSTREKPPRPVKVSITPALALRAYNG